MALLVSDIDCYPVHRPCLSLLPIQVVLVAHQIRKHCNQPLLQSSTRPYPNLQKNVKPCGGGMNGYVDVEKDLTEEVIIK